MPVSDWTDVKLEVARSVSPPRTSIAGNTMTATNNNIILFITLFPICSERPMAAHILAVTPPPLHPAPHLSAKHFLAFSLKLTPVESVPNLVSTQVPRRKRNRTCCHNLRRPRREQFAARITASGTEINDPVRRPHDIGIVLDHNDRVTRIA